MTPNEIKWLTWGARHHRPAGAPQWDEQGTLKAITDCCGTWDLATATEHVLAHARDPQAKTPFAIRGAAPSSTTPERAAYYPPKPAESCRVHPGEWVGSCRICRGPKTVDEEPGDRPTRRQEASRRAGEHIAALRLITSEGANA